MLCDIEMNSQEGESSKKLIPHGLGVAQSVVPGIDANRTIVTDNIISNGTKFGPFPGRDAVESQDNNWMRYVTGVQSLDEANLVIFIHKKQLFFYVIRRIHAEMELLVWTGNKKTIFLETSLRRSLKTQKLDLAFLCQDCNAAFSTHYGLFTHWGTVHRPEESKLPRKRVQCPYCPKIISQRKNFKAHLLIHTGYSRSQPKKSQKNKIRNSFAKNKPKVLVKEVIEKPEEVEMSLFDEDGLEDSDEEKPREKCNICGMTFKFKNHLRNHQKFRHNIFTSDIGENSNKSKNCLNQMLSVNDPKHTFTCTLCLKSFTCRTSLIKHQKEIHPIKPSIYKCPICHKKFKTSASRYRHLKIIHSFRNFWCSVCLRKFNRKDNLKVHIKIKHNDNAFLLFTDPNEDNPLKT